MLGPQWGCVKGGAIQFRWWKLHYNLISLFGEKEMSKTLTNEKMVGKEDTKQERNSQTPAWLSILRPAE